MAVKNVEFTFDNSIYQQIDGVAIGSPLGLVLVNIYVGYFESILFKDVERPLNYFRYVDDSFVSYKSDYNINV